MTSSTKLSSSDIFGQMRWGLKDTVGAPKNKIHNAWEERITGEPGSAEKVITELKASVAQSPGDLQNDVTEAGTQTEEGTAKINRQMELCYEYALLYALTADQAYARSAAAIMLRFSEVMPKWKVKNPDGKFVEPTNKALLGDWRAAGFWRWHPLDLSYTLPMLRAYDIIRTTLPRDERNNILNNLFLYHKSFTERYTGLLPLYSNTAGYHLIPVIRYGQVLERPDFMHEVVNYWRDFMKVSYAPDGFFRELTADYHQQITWRTEGAIPSVLKGYTDPVGYHYAKTGERFEQLDLQAENAPFLKQVRDGVEVLALPDGKYVNLNDSWPKQISSKTPGKDAGRPGLLGITGLAKIGVPGMTAFLQFDGIRGHDHHDGLNIVWFAGGKEVFSDTGYQPIKGSNSTREWHTISASHNTVSVNGQTQFVDREKNAVPKRVKAFAAFPPKEGTKRSFVEAAQPAAAGFTNQGKLLIWDSTRPDVQAMEAEQERTYPGITSIYRRTLVMVSLAGDEGYLVDLFRIRGGKTHDYHYRGGLDEAYQLKFNQPLQPASETVYKLLQVKESGKITTPLRAEVEFDSGKPRLVSTLVNVFGSPSSTLELFNGEGPAIRRMGNAPFSFIRHSTAEGGELESSFVWVHEVSRGESRIKGVTAEEKDGNLIVRVDLGDRVDTIVSALEPDVEVTFQDVTLNGKLGFISQAAGEISGHLLHGTVLKKGDATLAQRPASLKGVVVGTLSQTTGDATHSLIVRPEGPLPAEGYRLAHIDFGDVIRFSIPVTGIVPDKDGLLRVDLAHEPGFVRKDAESVMVRFPGWRIQTVPTVTLQ